MTVIFSILVCNKMLLNEMGYEAHSLFLVYIVNVGHIGIKVTLLLLHLLVELVKDCLIFFTLSTKSCILSYLSLKASVK